MNLDKKRVPYRVLSLDGGGMRGLYTASLLNTLAGRFGQRLDVGKCFDLIVGTSTGSILAAGLVAGVPLPKIIELYSKAGPKIFKHPMPNNKFWKVLWGMRHFCSAANSNEDLEKVLQAVLGEETLGEIYKKRKIGFCVPTVNLVTHKPQIFKTAHDSKKNADDDRKLTEVCLASSSAPIILPIAAIKDPYTSGAESYFVDGGLWANNPILIGLIEALNLSLDDQPIEIISIGACPPASGVALTSSEINRGLLGWSFGLKILELSMDSQASGHQFAAQLLAAHYNRLGKPIDILRYDLSTPSAEQARFLNLDGASPKALNTLIQLGNSDALKIYGGAHSGQSDCEKLISIFKAMSTLHPEEQL